MIRKLNPQIRMFLLVLLTLGLLGLPAFAQDSSNGDAGSNGSDQTQEDSARDDGAAEDENGNDNGSDNGEENAEENAEENSGDDNGDEDADRNGAEDEDADRNGDDAEDAEDETPAAAEEEARDDAAAEEAATESEAPAIGKSRLVEIPVEPGMEEPGDAAWLRVLNLSPNAGAIDFNLEYQSDDAVHPDIPDFMQGVEYEGSGNYAELPSGQYTLSLPGQPDEDHDFTVNAGNFYTLVVYGLELPPEAEADEEQEGGFMGWLRGIFGGDDDNDAYHMDVQLLEDNLYQNNLEDEAIVRVMNAAPGAEDVTLAVADESGTLTGSAGYGDVTGTNRLDPAEFSGPLELRLAGSRAATIPFEDIDLTAGTVNTVFLVGTPIEDAPLRALVLSTPAFADSF